MSEDRKIIPNPEYETSQEGFLYGNQSYQTFQIGEGKWMNITGDQILDAASRMDWTQVVINGGPPCFHLEASGWFCGRSQRWHDKTASKIFHEFVSLHDLLIQYGNLE